VRRRETIKLKYKWEREREAYRASQKTSAHVTNLTVCEAGSKPYRLPERSALTSVSVRFVEPHTMRAGGFLAVVSKIKEVR
jgi:hypothetical protein